MRNRQFLTVGFAVSLLVWMGGLALAANEGADLEKTIEELRAENPGLSKEDARQLTDLAVADLERAEKGSIIQGPRGRGEEAGIIVQGPVGDEKFTPEGEALMKEANDLGQALHEKGYTPEQIHGEIEKQFGDRFREEAERHGGSGMDREQMERMRGEMEQHREIPEAYREAIESHEQVERPTLERPAVEPSRDRTPPERRQEGGGGQWVEPR